FFVHFAEVDTSGHGHDENSKQYNDALVSNDKWTGKIIDKLKELGLYDKTLVYITADHGFDEGRKSHSNAPFVFLATNDKGVMRNGRRDDVTPTILGRFGLALSEIDPPLDGRTLTKEDDRPAPTVPPGRPKAKPKKPQPTTRPAEAAPLPAP
ncbi:MAG: alkaline phosphatase family protein, partial [Planctomycetota bacterium]